MERVSSGWHPNPYSASSAGDRNWVEQLKVFIPATVTGTIVLPLTPSSASSRIPFKSVNLIALAVLSTIIFIRLVEITTCPSVSEILKSGTDFHFLITTSEDFDGQLSELVYLTSTRSSLHIFKLMPPLSRVKITTFAAVLWETTEATPSFAATPKQIITAVKILKYCDLNNLSIVFIIFLPQDILKLNNEKQPRPKLWIIYP